MVKIYNVRENLQKNEVYIYTMNMYKQTLKWKKKFRKFINKNFNKI